MYSTIKTPEEYAQKIYDIEHPTKTKVTIQLKPLMEIIEKHLNDCYVSRLSHVLLFLIDNKKVEIKAIKRSDENFFSIRYKNKTLYLPETWINNKTDRKNV